MARVGIPTCGAISSWKDVIAHIQRSALRGVDPQIDMAPSLSCQTLDSIFCKKLNLSTINPLSIRMLRTLEVVEIEDQNLHGSESNIDCINVGGNVRPFALHQVRDQILPDSGLTSGGNTSRDNIGDNVCSEVDNQNLPGCNHIQNI